MINYEKYGKPFRLDIGSYDANRIYEVRVYDPYMNLKYIISPEDVKQKSWQNFKNNTKWNKKMKPIL